MTRTTPRIHARIATAIIACALALAAAPAATADSGGIGTEPPKKATYEYADAKLRKGKAIAPETAPPRVKRAIRFANKIRKTKYKWGGGHGSFEDRGYDCSGAVGYMLHGGRMLKSPTTSGGLMSWGRKGKGKWISVYANSGHVYAVVAGLRFDTSGGPGPRWHKDMRSKRGFQVRHFKGH
jgi:cell wall-associated NlpC family hydrolase